MIGALLPLKDLVQAKSRLSGILSPSERRALAQAMAEDVLAVLAAHPDVTQTVLVSDDPGARLLASQYDARWQSESELGCRGLNAVVACAAASLLARAGTDPVLVLHADLPTLSEADVTAALDRQRAMGGLVIGTDLAGHGSNLLAFDHSSCPTFSFGVDSRRRHQLWAQRAGVEVAVLERPGIGLDVDDADDFRQLLDGSGGRAGERTAALLRGWPGARLAAVLASLGNTGDHRERDRANHD